jgi:hypothetical protein
MRHRESRALSALNLNAFRALFLPAHLPHTGLLLDLLINDFV